MPALSLRLTKSRVSGGRLDRLKTFCEPDCRQGCQNRKVVSGLSDFDPESTAPWQNFSICWPGRSGSPLLPDWQNLAGFGFVNPKRAWRVSFWLLGSQRLFSKETTPEIHSMKWEKKSMGWKWYSAVGISSWRMDSWDRFSDEVNLGESFKKANWTLRGFKKKPPPQCRVGVSLNRKQSWWAPLWSL